MTAKNKSDSYQDINWVSLETVRQHLFSRLRTPLQKAIELTRQSPARAVCQLQRAQNTLDAWAALIRWKQDPASIADEFESIDLRQLPDWVSKEIQRQASFSYEQSRQLFVHPATFYEGILQLIQIARSCGKINQIMVNDASAPRAGVWFRIVFVPQNDDQFQSKLSIMDTLTERYGADIPLQFALIADLLELNHTRFSLQNNTRTGHQAFAVAINDGPVDTPVKSPEGSAQSTSSTEAEPQQPAVQSKPRAIEHTTAATSLTVVTSAEASTTPTPPAPSAAKPQPLAEKPQKDTTPRPVKAAQADKHPTPPIVEPVQDEESTNPLPTVKLVEKAEEIDETDDLLAQVQDILLDYIGTADLLNRASEIVAKIYNIIETERQQSNGTGSNDVLDQPRLQQLYAILNARPASPDDKKPSELSNDDTRDILAAIQGLLMQPVSDIAPASPSATTTSAAEHAQESQEQPEQPVTQLEAAADEPAQDPSVSQNAEPSGK